jgi:hypothetical protein
MNPTAAPFYPAPVDGEDARRKVNVGDKDEEGLKADEDGEEDVGGKISNDDDDNEETETTGPIPSTTKVRTSTITRPAI